MTKILVTPKINPDLDGTSCCLAYANLLGTNGIVTGQPQSEVQYFIQNHHINISTRNDDENGSWENFILVDASSMKGMPKIVKANKVLEIIDHRQSEPEKEFSNAKIQNELIGAAATIIVERFIVANKKPLPDHAKLLYGAIYHNTLNFIATNATDRDRNAANYLEKEFCLSQNLIREMFDFSTKIVEKDPKTALESDAKEFGTGHAVKAYQLIVWGAGVLKDKGSIEKAITELNNKFNPEWSFVNIVDLESKTSNIFSERPEIFEKVFRVSFFGGWAKLPALLRKQIMPKIALQGLI